MSTEVVTYYERNGKKYVVLEVDESIINGTEDVSFIDDGELEHDSSKFRSVIDTRYITNKWDKKNKIKDGWIVAFGEEITETDFLIGALAAGISIYTSNPGAIYAWMNKLVEDSIREMSDSIRDKISNEIKDEIIKFAIEIITESIKGKISKEALKRFGNIDFKAGFGTYTGHNQVKAFGSKWKTMTTTNSWQPYVGIRL